MLRARPQARVAISPLINHNMHTFGRSYKVSLERYISGIKIGWIYIWIGREREVGMRFLTAHRELSPIRMGAHYGHHEFLLRNVHV